MPGFFVARNASIISLRLMALSVIIHPFLLAGIFIAPGGAKTRRQRRRAVDN
jgi:hypothetical protein